MASSRNTSTIKSLHRSEARQSGSTDAQAWTQRNNAQPQRSKSSSMPRGSSSAMLPPSFPPLAGPFRPTGTHPPAELQTQQHGCSQAALGRDAWPGDSTNSSNSSTGDWRPRNASARPRTSQPRRGSSGEGNSGVQNEHVTTVETGHPREADRSKNPGNGSSSNITEQAKEVSDKEQALAESGGKLDITENPPVSDAGTRGNASESDHDKHKHKHKHTETPMCTPPSSPAVQEDQQRDVQGIKNDRTQMQLPATCNASTQATKPIPPPVVCLAGYHSLLSHIDSLIAKESSRLLENLHSQLSLSIDNTAQILHAGLANQIHTTILPHLEYTIPRTVNQKLEAHASFQHTAMRREVDHALGTLMPSVVEEVTGRVRGSLDPTIVALVQAESDRAVRRALSSPEGWLGVEKQKQLREEIRRTMIREGDIKEVARCCVADAFREMSRDCLSADDEENPVVQVVRADVKESINRVIHQVVREEVVFDSVASGLTGEELVEKTLIKVLDRKMETLLKDLSREIGQGMEEIVKREVQVQFNVAIDDILRLASEDYDGSTAAACSGSEGHLFEDDSEDSLFTTRRRSTMFEKAAEADEKLSCSPIRASPSKFAFISRSIQPDTPPEEDSEAEECRTDVTTSSIQCSSESWSSLPITAPGCTSPIQLMVLRKQLSRIREEIKDALENTIQRENGPEGD